MLSLTESNAGRQELGSRSPTSWGECLSHVVLGLLQPFLTGSLWLRRAPNRPPGATSSRQVGGGKLYVAVLFWILCSSWKAWKVKSELTESASAYMRIILKCRLLHDFSALKAREQQTPGNELPGHHGLADLGVKLFWSAVSGLGSVVLCSSGLGWDEQAFLGREGGVGEWGEFVLLTFSIHAGFLSV